MPLSATSDRAVPHNLEAERALLGSILLDNAALKLVVPTLGKDDFFSAGHRIIYEKMLELDEKKRGIDLVTLSEALNQDGTLVKAGGAAYLSALTDGVPLGTQAAVPEYLRIVKEKSVLRRIITSANNLIARAMSGNEDAASVMDQATAQIEEIRQEKIGIEPTQEKPKAAPLPQRYPLIPEEAWPPAVSIYRDAVGGTIEASDNWHFAAFYAVVGALLGRSVMTRMGKYIYPNLYVVLVGLLGGDGKDTAIDYAVMELLPRVEQELYTPPTIDSKAGFIKSWAEWLSRPRETTNNGYHGSVNRAILRISEFRDIIDKINYTGTQSIATIMNECYDGPAEVARGTVSDPCRVPFPHLVVAACSARDYLRELDEHDLTSGFGRRLLIIPGDIKRPVPEPEPYDEAAMGAAAGIVRDAMHHWQSADSHCLQFSEDARKLWNSWYVGYKRRVAEGDLIGAMTIGDRTNLRKVALINAALDRAERIEEHHLGYALAFGDFLYESRWPVFSEFGNNPNLEIENKIVEKVKTKGGRIRKRQLQMSLPRVDSETFNRRLNYLCDKDGRLEMKQEGRMWYVIYREM